MSIHELRPQISGDVFTRDGSGYDQIRRGWDLTIDHQATPHGLAPLLSSSPHVGVVGYMLGSGSGIGWLASRSGFGADSLRQVELVTADGSLRRASPSAGEGGQISKHLRERPVAKAMRASREAMTRTAPRERRREYSARCNPRVLRK